MNASIFCTSFFCCLVVDVYTQSNPLFTKDLFTSGIYSGERELCVIVRHWREGEKCQARKMDYHINKFDQYHEELVHPMAEGEEEALINVMLFEAAFNGDLEAFAYLVTENGANANAKDEAGRTPLHVASSRGHVEFIEVIVLKFFAHVMAVDKKYQWTPLHYAAWYGQSNVVQALSQLGVCVEASDSFGCTPLHLATENGHCNAAGLLICLLGANVNALDNDGRTPLHYACKEGHQFMVGMLISEHNANLHCKDDKGFTPLHYAANNGCASCIRLLVLSEINSAIVNEVCDAGQTPLHIASNRGNIEAVHALVLDCRACVEVKDICGATPLDCAGASNDEIVAFLSCFFPLGS